MTMDRCPYCDKQRRHDSSGRLRQTCGDNACHNMAIGDALATKRGFEVHWPRVTGEVDFGNGFAAHNLCFRPARERF